MTTSAMRYTRMTGLAQTAQLRTATFRDRAHLVVPVVALKGNVVIRAMNSTAPEFVPAEILGFAPTGWDGRPVMPDHPNQGRESANRPATLEAFAFGSMFNTRFLNGDLHTEAWLDIARAEELGGDPADVIRRCRAGEVVEVSVGAFIALEETPGGTYNGVDYAFTWRDIVPDHLAMLPQGVLGACSVEMGCGAPRAARATTNPDTGEPDMRTPSMLSRALAHIFAPRVAAADPTGTSDTAVRNALHDALRAVEPGFDMVVEVFADTSTVVYIARPGDNYEWYSRTFTTDAAGVATLNDDRVRVEQVTQYQVVKALSTAADRISVAPEPSPVVTAGTGVVAAAVPRAAGCSCSNHSEGHPAPADAVHGEIDMKNANVSALVGRVLAGKAKLFTESDRATLEAMSETQLAAIAVLAECDGTGTPAPAPAPAAAVPAPVAAAPAVSPAEAEAAYLASMPEGLRQTLVAAQQIVNAAAAADARTRTALIGALTAAQTVYTAAALQAKPTDELRSLAELVGINDNDADPIDFSGRGVATISANAGDADAGVYLNPPDAYNLAGMASARNKARGIADA